MDKREIGLRIRAIRKGLKLNKEEYAEKIGISAVFLNQVECGSRGLSIKTLEKICKHSGVSADYIVFGKENWSDFETPTVKTLKTISDDYNYIVSEYVQDLKYLIDKVDAVKKSNDLLEDND